MNNKTLILNDYCTGDVVEIYKDAIKNIITSRVGNMAYSTLICDNGQRVGVMQSEKYIREVLAMKS